MKVCLSFYEKNTLLVFRNIPIWGRGYTGDVSKINVKDALEILGYDNDINETSRIDGARITLLLIVKLELLK